MYKLWLNEERTVMVREWDSGKMEVALRETSAHVWGPPIQVSLEGGLPPDVTGDPDVTGSR